MSPQYGELRPTSGWDRLTSLGHPSKFQLVSRLGSLTARHLVVGVRQTLRRWTEGATYIRQGDHHVGHWPTFLVLLGLVFMDIHKCEAVGCPGKWNVILWTVILCTLFMANKFDLIHTDCKPLVVTVPTWVLNGKGPAQREAAVVDGVVRYETNQERWTGWSNSSRVTRAVPAELRWTGAGAVIERHAIVKTTCCRFHR